MSQNALDPNLMTAAERLTEIGEILAAGLLRLRARETDAGRGPKTIEGRQPPKKPMPRRGSA